VIVPGVGPCHPIDVTSLLGQGEGYFTLGATFSRRKRAVGAARFSQRESCAKHQRLAPVCAVAQIGFALSLQRRRPLGECERAADLLAAKRAEAEQLGMARPIVRFERLRER
jgi:hypothetical protein